MGSMEKVKLVWVYVILSVAIVVVSIWSYVYEFINCQGMEYSQNIVYR